MGARFFRTRLRIALLILSVVFMICNSSFAFAARRSARTLRDSYDVIVAGGGMAGIAATIQAARLGVSVLTIEATPWFGGQAMAAGCTTMDDASRLRSGIYREFIERMSYYYGTRGKSMGTCYWSNTSTAFEPHIGQQTILAMLDETRRKTQMDFLMSSEIIAVEKDGRQITGVTVKSPSGNRKFKCKVLIDATEYGDVMPLAQVPYRAGNSVSRFINNEAMIQDITWIVVMRRYSGGVPSHLRPKNPLPGYDLARRNYAAFVTRDGYNFRNTFPIETPLNFESHIAYRGLPDSSTPWGYDAERSNWKYISKSAINWANDYPGTYAWTNGKRGLPVAYLEDRRVRLQVEREALIKALHFVYYVQNELGEDWSVADDEYDNQVLPEAAKGLPREWQEIVRHMPPIPYVRESRRAIGKYTLTSRALLDNSLSYRDGHTNREFPDSIAIGRYILDLHGAATDGDMEWELDEKASSAILNRPRGRFQVPMRILIPDSKHIEGFLVAEKNLSMSRLAAGALRMGPISMMSGQAAGALAALSVKYAKNPSEIPAVLVQWELLNAGVVLSLCNYSDILPEHSLNKTIQLSNLYGLVIPNEYPHASSQNYVSSWSNIDNIAFEMAAIREDDKGIFGVENFITRQEAFEILSRAVDAFKIEDANLKREGKDYEYISRGDFAKLVCNAFPKLQEANQVQNANHDSRNYYSRTRLPFKIAKNRNSEYVEILARAGVLEIYRIESEFRYGKPVTKGEAADVVVRAVLENSRR